MNRRTAGGLKGTAGTVLPLVWHLWLGRKMASYATSYWAHLLQLEVWSLGSMFQDVSGFVFYERFRCHTQPRLPHWTQGKGCVGYHTEAVTKKVGSLLVTLRPLTGRGSNFDDVSSGLRSVR